MYFWLMTGLLTTIAALAVLVPLFRRGARTPDPSGERRDIAIYRDQLAEIDADLERGIVGAREAAAARVEISRRLLKAGAGQHAPDTASDRKERPAASLPARLAALATVIAIPALGFGLYFVLGSPGFPDQPLAARLDKPIEQQDIMALIAKVERRLAENPEQGEAWDMLARIYMRMGRYDKAVSAWPEAIRLLGATAEREADFGEALTMAADGVLTDAAIAAFERARKIEPDAIKPRFFLAVALGQKGRYREAVTAWNRILASARGDEPWLPAVRRELAAVRERLGDAPPDGKGEGPPGTDLPPVEEMVAQLAARLADRPDDPAGWAMLVRSYRVLARTADAEAAIARAREALKDAPDRLAEFEKALAKASPDVADGGATSSQPGPSAEQMAAAANMDEAQRARMIRGMVSGLQERLDRSPDDIEGWLRLIRSYAVLGDGDAAAEAVRRARAQFQGRKREIARIENLVESLDLNL